jgi:glycerophosphoryl diester phosphodiesterase
MRLAKKWRTALVLLAFVSVVLTLINASWLAPTPAGRLTLVARGGVGQAVDPGAGGGDGCTARHIRPGGANNYIENSLPSIYRALKIGAQAVELPVQRSKDGQMLVFGDSDLGCRTNGHGAVRDHDLAALKTLDIGHGYSSDGGRTFPLRGRGIGAMPTVEDVLRYVPTAGIVFAFKGKDPAEADALAAAFRRAGIAIDEKYGFTGDPALVARMKQVAPAAWAFSPGGSCLADYARTGWTSLVPASCRNSTIIVPLGERWKIWGWPYRFLDRMAKAGSKVMIVGGARGTVPTGLDQPEQYEKVPARFHGYLLVEDIYTMGPALRR